MTSLNSTQLRLSDTQTQDSGIKQYSGKAVQQYSTLPYLVDVARHEGRAGRCIKVDLEAEGALFGDGELAALELVQVQDGMNE